MAGIAWTLHPDLFYQKYGTGLVQLWDSGALGALFKPMRRLSKNIGNAIASGMAPLRPNTEAKKADAEAADNCSVSTEDEAMRRVNQEPWDTTPEPSTSQQNELAFQGDHYTQLRRSRRQSERLREIYEVRKRSLEGSSDGKSGSRRGSGSRRRGSLQRKRDISLRRTLGGAGTPLSDVDEFALPVRTVTIGGSGSPGDLLEDEDADDVKTLRSSKSNKVFQTDSRSDLLVESDSRQAFRGTQRRKKRAAQTAAANKRSEKQSGATPTTERSGAADGAFSEGQSREASTEKSRSRAKRNRRLRRRSGKRPKSESLPSISSASLTPTTKEGLTPVEGGETSLLKITPETSGIKKRTRRKHKKRKDKLKASSGRAKKSRAPADDKGSARPLGVLEDFSLEPSSQFTKQSNNGTLVRSQEVGLRTSRDETAQEGQKPAAKTSRLSTLKDSPASSEKGTQGSGVTRDVVAETRRTLTKQAEKLDEGKTDRTHSKASSESSSSTVTSRRNKLGRRKKRRHKKRKSTRAVPAMEGSIVETSKGAQRSQTDSGTGTVPAMEDGIVETSKGAQRSQTDSSTGTATAMEYGIVETSKAAQHSLSVSSSGTVVATEDGIIETSKEAQRSQTVSSTGTAKDKASRPASRRRAGRKGKDRAKRTSAKARSVRADVALPPPAEVILAAIAGTQLPEPLVTSAGPSAEDVAPPKDQLAFLGNLHDRDAAAERDDGPGQGRHHLPDMTSRNKASKFWPFERKGPKKKK